MCPGPAAAEALQEPDKRFGRHKSTKRGPSATAPGKSLASSFAPGGNPSRKEVVRVQSQKRRYSSWRSCSQRDRRDAVFERSVRHFSDCFIRSRAVSLDNDRLVLALGCIE